MDKASLDMNSRIYRECKDFYSPSGAVVPYIFYFRRGGKRDISMKTREKHIFYHTAAAKQWDGCSLFEHTAD